MLAKQLKGKRNGDGWMCRCPAHRDKQASLKVSSGQKGTIVFCHAGCDIDKLCAALNITKQQLFYDYGDSGVGGTEADVILRRMISEHQAEPVEWTHQLGDVMWAAVVTDKALEVFTEGEWAEFMAMVTVEYPRLMLMDYAEAMREYVIVRDGPVFQFLRPLWEHRGRPNWIQMRDYAMDQMREKYREWTT
jgi:hypothetical protein